MSGHAYTEDQLVEQPAIGLFAELGWITVSALEEIFGPAEPSPHPSPSGRGSEGEGRAAFGRETTGEVVLEARLRAALVRLNPALPSEALEAAVVELTRSRSALSPAAANREVWQLLREGVKVSVADTGDSTPHPGPLPGRGGEGVKSGGQRTERVRVVDWECPANNDFLLVSQMTITGPLYTCRPDLIGFVNGLPLVLIELKQPGVPARQAFDENLTSYKHAQNGIPALFWYNALLIASNGTDNRVFPGKHSGVIVDYANVFVSLEKALAIYGHAIAGSLALPLDDELKGRQASPGARRNQLIHRWHNEDRLGVGAAFPDAPTARRKIATAGTVGLGLAGNPEWLRANRTRDWAGTWFWRWLKFLHLNPDF